MSIIGKITDFFYKCMTRLSNVLNIFRIFKIFKINDKTITNRTQNNISIRNDVPIINLINSGRTQNKIYGNIIRIPMYKIPNQVPIVIPSQVVINNLKVLSELKEGQKLWLTDGRLAIDSSHFPTYTRWWYGQKRNIILNQIEEDIKDACKSANREVRELLANASIGIQNMKKTYPDYSEKIDSIIDLITKIQ